VRALKDGKRRGEIPGIYTATNAPQGLDISWFVVAFDDEQREVANVGSRQSPFVLHVDPGLEVAADLAPRERLPLITRVLLASFGPPGMTGAVYLTAGALGFIPFFIGSLVGSTAVGAWLEVGLVGAGAATSVAIMAIASDLVVEGWTRFVPPAAAGVLGLGVVGVAGAIALGIAPAGVDNALGIATTTAAAGLIAGAIMVPFAAFPVVAILTESSDAME
jgi:hypothetical protein